MADTSRKTAGARILDGGRLEAGEAGDAVRATRGRAASRLGRAGAALIAALGVQVGPTALDAATARPHVQMDATRQAIFEILSHYLTPGVLSEADILADIPADQGLVDLTNRPELADLAPEDFADNYTVVIDGERYSLQAIEVDGVTAWYIRTGQKGAFCVATSDKGGEGRALAALGKLVREKKANEGGLPAHVASL